ncbi:delta 9-fatty acid desaturase protein [Gloeophyllum trabeum ATCC 11539]|uniref:Acyl-CoA desaturase n=1 Tax=Gloeophyllum trabeum (strain ATCC 11539 / FP-39264 / Madison 617) TaxID=670483 RepID=S7RPF0_GLOTA|nr:delta 9-fatty acid desaturase protein [Gloeophyllum trabeum ATCC 11539]EPQ54719.1 delta 9-fatty acid desaturase protein [Gloeophyllum trabeum ATCC 11539]
MKPTSTVSSTSTDDDVPKNYVQHILRTQKQLPPVTWHNWWKELQWINVLVLTITPCLAIYGAYTTKLTRETAILSIVYYFITGLGITAGYHRLWSHRSYNASKPLEYFLALAGAGAVQGAIKWWCRGHRAHHRYTDTELDPYSAQRGFLWSHLGWMVVKPRRKIGAADVSDLSKSAVVQWQYKYYLWLMLGMGYTFPAVVAGLCWGDWRGGFFYAGALRLTFVQHSTFCVNSLAHWLGESPFDDKHTPKDHVLTALVTVGEGYHNFHHQFPMDYRNAIKWYQYDPTKWFIAACKIIGLASHLKTFPDNEVKKGQLTMQLKRLREVQDQIHWASDIKELPVITWDTFQEQSAHRPLVLIAGIIHDISPFLDNHPGGRHLLVRFLGKDATAAFFGGVYDHSNAAHNLLSMYRVAILEHGYQQGVEEKVVPPAQRLRILRYNEMGYGSSSDETLVGDEEVKLL